MKLGVCIEIIFGEVPFMERVGEVRKMGFSAFDFWGWADKDIEQLDQKRREHQLQVSAFGGNRKTNLIDSNDREKFIQEMNEAIKVAKKLECPTLIVLSDALDEKGHAVPPARPLSSEQKYKNTVDALKELAPIAEAEKIIMEVEMLNTPVDHRGYYLDSSKVAFDIIDKVGSDNVKLLYDVYHAYIMGDDVVATIRENIDKIGYVHIADVPGRGEPGTGEIDFHQVNSVLKEVGYTGFVGFEFFPTIDSQEALKKAKTFFV